MDDGDKIVELYLQLVRDVVEHVRLGRQLSASRDLPTSTGLEDFSIRYHPRELSAFYGPRLYPPPPSYPVSSLPLHAQHSAAHEL